MQNRMILGEEFHETWEDIERQLGRHPITTPLDIRTERERKRKATNPFASFLPTYQHPGTGADIAEQFLTETPEAVYYSSPVAEAFTREGITGKEFPFRGGAMQGQTPAKRRFYQQSFSDIYNQYLGELGKQAREEELPTMSFREYMATDPLSARYEQMLPQERGYYGAAPTQLFAPRTRQIYY